MHTPKAIPMNKGSARAVSKRSGKSYSCPRPLWWRFLVFASRNCGPSHHD